MKKSNESSSTSVREIMKLAQNAYNETLDRTAELMKMTYQISPAFLQDCVKFSLEDMDTFTEEQIHELYDKYYVGVESTKCTETEDMLSALKGCKELSNTAYEMREQYKEIQKLYDESVDEQWKHRNSKEYREATLNRIETWKQEIEKMDPVKDAKVIRDLRGKIEFLESTITLDFINDRIKNVEKEKTSIIRQFFSEREGSYALERCAARSPKFGFDKGWYKFFFNLEENFLPEEYHVFNNLFLFNVMRFVGYQDPYNVKERGMVQSIINSLTGLKYHKFADTGMEEVIVQLIEEYDGYFEEYREKFEKENTTHPNHPARIASSKKADADRRNELLASMEKFGFEIPEKVDEMTTKELHEYFNNAMEEMVAKNTKTKELHGEAEAVVEDDVTKIRPTFLKDKFRNPVDLINGKYYYMNTDESSEDYKKLFDDLKEHDIDLAYQMFELKNPDVPTDLFEDLTEEEQNAVKEECKVNFWYFWRYVLHLQVQIHQLLTADAMLQRVHTLEETVRQGGKTTTTLAYLLWIRLFHVESYDDIRILARDTTFMHQIAHKMDRLLKDVPEWLVSKEEKNGIGVGIHAYISMADLIDGVHKLDETKVAEGKIEERKKDLVIIDEFEFINDIDAYMGSKINEFKDFLSKVELHASSTASDPIHVPNLNLVLSKNAMIYNIYKVDVPHGDDFYKMLRDYDLSKNPEVINYIEVSTDRILTEEEIAHWNRALVGEPVIAMNSLAVYYRDVFCKHVTQEMTHDALEDGVDMTDESYHPYYITELKDPVEQIKEKMDTEGTISVADALAGEPLVAKKQE